MACSIRTQLAGGPRGAYLIIRRDGGILVTLWNRLITGIGNAVGNSRIHQLKISTLPDRVREAVSPGIQEETLSNVSPAKAAHAHFMASAEYKRKAKRIQPLARAVAEKAKNLGIGF